MYDFESQIQKSEEMNVELAKLQARHIELKKENQQYKQKIQRLKSQREGAPIHY